MNKKNILLILILTVFFSVMIISTIGNEAVIKSNVYEEDLVFYDNNGAKVERVDQESGNEEKIIEIEASDLDKSDIVYRFSVEILPENVTENELDYFVDGTDAVMKEINPDAEAVAEGEGAAQSINRFRYYEITFDYYQRFVTTVNFKLNAKKEDKKKTVYLRFIFHITYEDDC